MGLRHTYDRSLLQGPSRRARRPSGGRIGFLMSVEPGRRVPAGAGIAAHRPCVEACRQRPVTCLTCTNVHCPFGPSRTQ
jgi:hypothetical protein